MSDIYDSFQNSKEKQLLIEFKSEELGDGTILGIVIDFSQEFVLIHFFSKDFFFNGLSLIRTSSITNYREDEKDSFATIAIEKLYLKPPQVNFNVNLLSMQTSLNDIKDFFPLVSITDINNINNINILSLGKIMKANIEDVALLEIDADAEWFEEETIIPYDEIISVEFGGSYENALWVVGKDDLLLKNEGSK